MWACARFTKCPCGRRHAPAPERFEISVDALPANGLGGLFLDDSAHDQVQDLAHQVLVLDEVGKFLLQVQRSDWWATLSIAARPHAQGVNQGGGTGEQREGL
ncbi:hypothetical protein [Pseudomonas aeruginosa]|uniref:hypothetical protein n=1 Tax=Pseudomonas aeruginosa TaxID=287 RepID=UPI000E290DFF|nr:hypothetical protein [Pseudomonas aeruginosa]AXL77223.1 hypothetical protein Y82_3150 [Pseudomonas aeruginosa]